ncbi:hypothetical protein GWI33_013320, partial [Rhynchophorus ferrugineus]
VSLIKDTPFEVETNEPTHTYTQNHRDPNHLFPQTENEEGRKRKKSQH